MTDLLVIGGGAAGLMAAGAACARGLTVTVLEHNPKGPGQKLLITGKGRCNVTNDSDVREFLPYVRHNGRFLYSSLYAFPPSAAMELFESLGVPLKSAGGGCFPGVTAPPTCWPRCAIMHAMRNLCAAARKSWSSRTASARVL